MSEPEDAEIQAARDSLIASMRDMSTSLDDLGVLLDDPRRLLVTNDVIRNMPLDHLQQIDRIILDVRDGAATDYAALILVDKERAEVVASQDHVDSVDRSVSYCQVVVASKRPWVVSDTRKLVDRWRKRLSPVGAYMGVPVAVKGEVIGSLCAFTRSGPRTWTLTELRELTDCATQVEKILN